MELLRPESAEAAAAALGNGSVALAGGTELVPLLRDGIVRAEKLVELRDVVPREVEGARIGAGATLAELEVDPTIPQVLREACALAASPQLRSMSTLGGNLLQATRCWYWRLKFPCYLNGGDVCHAKAGQHREHAIFGNERCASAHPSDPAAALLALGARLRTTTRELPLAELYRLPTDDDRNVTALEPGELILEVEVPQPQASVYLKAMERRKWSFAIVGVAAARFEDGIRLGLAGVAPIPWALSSLDALEPGELILEVEVPQPQASVYLKAMERRKWSFAIVGVAAARFEDGVRLGLAGVAPIPWALSSLDALEQATPLPGTAYKVEVARALIRRAVEAVDAPAGT